MSRRQPRVERFDRLRGTVGERGVEQRDAESSVSTTCAVPPVSAEVRALMRVSMVSTARALPSVNDELRVERRLSISTMTLFAPLLNEVSNSLKRASSVPVIERVREDQLPRAAVTQFSDEFFVFGCPEIETLRRASIIWRPMAGGGHPRPPGRPPGP